jgi:hypothetical protein
MHQQSAEEQRHHNHQNTMATFRDRTFQHLFSHFFHSSDLFGIVPLKSHPNHLAVFITVAASIGIGLLLHWRKWLYFNGIKKHALLL